MVREQQKNIRDLFADTRKNKPGLLRHVKWIQMCVGTGQPLNYYRTFTCEAPKGGWSHVLYVQVSISGRKGDDDVLSLLGLDDDYINLSI